LWFCTLFATANSFTRNLLWSRPWIRPWESHLGSSFSRSLKKKKKKRVVSDFQWLVLR
jgi:hypothetical protein